MRSKRFTQLVSDVVLGAIPFIAILVIWQAYQEANLQLGWLVPSPWETAQSFGRLLSDGTLWDLILISFRNLIPPFILGSLAAVIVGIGMGVNRVAYKIFFPFLTAVYPVPSLAWLPFLIIFLGFTQTALWAVIFISTFNKMLYVVIGGVQNVNVEYILAAKNLGFSKFKIIWSVVVPATLPEILTGLRMGFGSAWRSLVGAEMLVATLGGLGRFIWVSQWYFKFDQVVAGLVVISLISILIENVAFRKLERSTLIKWGLIREDHAV